MTGSSIFSMRPASGSFAGRVDLLHRAVGGRDAVENARRGRDQVDVELALEPLLDDLHVEQAEEAAAEAEPERGRRFRLEVERRVVQPQLLERVAQLAGTRCLRPGYSPAKTIDFISLKPGNGSDGRVAPRR